MNDHDDYMKDKWGHPEWMTCPAGPHPRGECPLTSVELHAALAADREALMSAYRDAPEPRP